MRLDWLPNILRTAGVDVWEQPGWQTRGRDLTVIRGVVWHHTASSPRTSDTATAAILRDGRRDLKGPLAQVGVERDGTWVIIAAGRANHNGYGEWGNDSIGVEAYNDGRGEPWPSVQLNSIERGIAAICAHLDLSAHQVKGHRETDPRRKIDPFGIDMNAARERIGRLIVELTAPPTPSPSPSPPPQEDDMRLLQSDPKQGGDGKVWAFTAFEYKHVSPSVLAEYQREGYRVEPRHPWDVAAWATVRTRR